MNSKYVSIAIFALCCISDTCLGENVWNEWRVETQSATAALSNHTITLIKKTSPRELWIASTEGIFLFDGMRTDRKPIRWNSDNELPVKRAIDFVMGPDGSIYLFTSSDGIFKISDDRDQFEPLFDANSEEKIGRIHAVSSPGNGDVALVISGDRVLQVILSTGTISEVIVNPNSSIKSARGLLASRDGDIYVVYDAYIVRLVWQVDRFVPQMRLHCNLEISMINTSTQTADGNFYASDGFGNLHRLLISDEECTRSPTPRLIRNATREARINSVKFLENSNTLAISTDKGLLLVDDNAVNEISTQNSPMRSDEVISVDEAAKDNIIVGSFAGVIHAAKSHFTAVTRLPQNESPTIVAIASEKGLGTFVATKKSILREIQHNNGVSFETFDLNRAHATVSALEVTNTDIWVGFQNGLLLQCDLAGGVDFCKNGQEFRLSKSPVTSIAKLSQGVSGVLATTLDGKAFKVKSSEDQWITSLIFEFESEDSKLLGVKTAFGLAWFFDLKGVWLSPLHDIENLPLNSQKVISLANFARRPWAMANAHNAVFFATPGGEVIRYESKDGFNSESLATWSQAVNETIFSIEVDFLGRPWVATSRGLWVQNKATDFRIQIQTHGAHSIATDYGASHTDYRGHVYFGGTGGLLIIRSPEEYPQPLSGSVILSSVRLNETHLPIANSSLGPEWQLSVESSRTKIEFELGLSKMLWFQTATFQHKLEGFDADWQDTGNINVATYQNLPPGKYAFRARGADSTGVWSDNEINLSIEVLPPMWQSWWALLCYMVLALVTFLYLKRINDRHVAQQARLKLAEEGSAAFARLEDDYQAQREANETLLLRRAPSAKALLDVVETVLAAQLADSGADQAVSAVINKLRTLHSLQTVTDRTTSQENTDLHAVTEDIAAQLAASNEVAARSIISNEVSKRPAPLEHAVYICLVIQETLELAILGRRFDDLMDPLVLIRMPPATLTENNEYSYELRIEDSGLKDNNANAVEQLLPLTFHLIESGGGELSEDYDAGNILVVRLLFPAHSQL